MAWSRKLLREALDKCLDVDDGGGIPPCLALQPQDARVVFLTEEFPLAKSELGAEFL